VGCVELIAGGVSDTRQGSVSLKKGEGYVQHMWVAACTMVVGVWV
jgi:hypothetical protein